MSFKIFSGLMVVLALSAIITLSWVVAKASWDNDPYENVPICVAESNQYNVKGIEDGKGGAIFVWVDGRNNNDDLYAQRISAAGDILWDAPGVPITVGTPWPQTNPAIISDAVGGTIIAWSDNRNWLDEDVFAQRIDDDGNILWDEAGVQIIGAEKDQYNVFLVPDGSGGANLIWQDNSDPEFAYLYAQRIDQNGNLLWDPAGVKICDSQTYQVAPQAISDGQGGFIVVWESVCIYAQYIDASGNQVWDPQGVQLLHTPICPQMFPKIISDSSNGAIISCVAFYDSDWVYDVCMQRINSSGELLWNDTGIMVGKVFSYHYWDPPFALVSDLENGAIVIWKYSGIDYDSNKTSTNFYAQHLDPNGNKLWGENGYLFLENLHDQHYLQAISDLDSGVILTWNDARGGGADNIFAQRVDATGNVIWNSTGVPISIAYGSQERPCIVNSYSGSAILAWEDERDEGNEIHNIYAQKVFDDGTLPVELAYFTATNQADQILLEWGTESEEDNLGWNIYRSGSREGSFAKINPQLIPGAGNSSTPTDYTFKDENVKHAKKYIYYLEQIDFNGTTSHSHYVTSSPEPH